MENCTYSRRQQLLFLWVIIALTSLIYLTLYSSFSRMPHGINHTDIGRRADSNVGSDVRFLVNTPTCRILNISPFNKDVMWILKNGSGSEPEDCSHKYHEWTYIENAGLLTNKSAILQSGHSLDSVACCYSSIKRVKQSPDKYDEDADSQIRISKVCKRIRMDDVNPLKDNFIRVVCISKTSPKHLKTYFHAIPQLTKTWKIMKKVHYRKSLLANEDKGNIYNVSPLPNRIIKGGQPTQKPKLNQGRRLPPNVILLGMDSMSRLNFHRYMKKTRKYLELIGAVEMRGYTSVGDGTFPNAVAFMSGYHLEDLERICHFSPDTAQDSCPYIWNKFNEANYLTSYSEDGNTFTYLKTGFVKQPTDYYFRTLALAMRDHFSENLGALDCVGSKSTLNVIHNFINDTLIFAARNNVPIFIYNWSDFAHDYFNHAKYADIVYKEFLQNIDLTNTILFVIGDHGPRYGPLRETYLGWLEDRLPTFWVYLPKNIRRQFTTWMPALRRNSRRLTSPFDLYHTLVHILTTFTPVEKFPDAKSIHGEIIPRMYGQTLFEEVPISRKCHGIGVTSNICPCGVLRRLPTNSRQIVAASKTAVIHINQQLPKECAQLRIKNIGALAMIDMLQGDSTVENSTVTYVVGFETSPGGFLLEATVEAIAKLGSYHVIGTIMRINKINKTHVGCVKNAFLEKVCFCVSDRRKVLNVEAMK